MFPSTPQTLIQRITQLAPDEDAGAWERLVELYTPPLRLFVRQLQSGASEEDVEDVMQEVFIRLVAVLREGKIDRTKGKFRAYLAAMTRRILIDRYRAERARPQRADSGIAHRDSGIFSGGVLGSVPSDDIAGMDPGVALDIRWREAEHVAAVAHVLTKTALSERSKEIYLALERGLSPKNVAAKFQVSRDVVKQVKSRIDRAIAAVERCFAE